MGLGLIGFIVGSVVMGLVQISLFCAFPRQMRNMLAYFPVGGILLNVGLSFLIVLVTGVSAFIGLLNLTGSILFGAYLVGYRATRSLKKSVRKIFGIPYVVIEDEEVM